MCADVHVEMVVELEAEEEEEEGEAAAAEEEDLPPRRKRRTVFLFTTVQVVFALDMCTLYSYQIQCVSR